jgi:hypothetical protein
MGQELTANGLGAPAFAPAAAPRPAWMLFSEHRRCRLLAILFFMMPLLMASGGCFYAFARAMPEDIED